MLLLESSRENQCFQNLQPRYLRLELFLTFFKVLGGFLGSFSYKNLSYKKTCKRQQHIYRSLLLLFSYLELPQVFSFSSTPDFHVNMVVNNTSNFSSVANSLEFATELKLLVLFTKRFVRMSLRHVLTFNENKGL